MVSEPDHFSFTSDLRSIFLIIKIFSVFKTFAALANLFVFNFEKGQNYQLWSSLFDLSANRNLKSKVENMIQKYDHNTIWEADSSPI